MNLVNDDSAAFDIVMEAFRLSKKSKREEKIRFEKIEKAYKNAVSPPLEMLKISNKLLLNIKSVYDKINPNCLSDLGVAIEMIEAAANGSVMNISINLKEINDKKYNSRIEEQVLRITEKNDSLLFDLSKKKNI